MVDFTVWDSLARQLPALRPVEHVEVSLAMLAAVAGVVEAVVRVGLQHVASVPVDVVAEPVAVEAVAVVVAEAVEAEAGASLMTALERCETFETFAVDQFQKVLAVFASMCL